MERAQYLRMVIIAMTDYFSTFGRFPPATVCDSKGKPMYSWRGTVAAYLDGVPLSDIERLATAQSKAPPTELYCWDEDSFGRQTSDTSVLAVTGSGTFFSLEAPRFDSDFVWDAIVLIQTCSSHVHWLRPGDLDVDSLPASLTDGVDERGLFVVFLDGEIWRLAKNVPDKNIVAFFTLEGARHNDRDELLGAFVIEKHMQVKEEVPSIWHGKILSRRNRGH